MALNHTEEDPDRVTTAVTRTVEYAKLKWRQGNKIEETFLCRWFSVQNSPTWSYMLTIFLYVKKHCVWWSLSKNSFINHLWKFHPGNLPTANGHSVTTPPAEGFRSSRGFPGYKARSLKDATCSGMFVEMMEYDDWRFCSSNFTHSFFLENSYSRIFDCAHFRNKNRNISNSIWVQNERKEYNWGKWVLITSCKT